MDLTDIRADLTPTGALRASINLGNPVLAQGAPEAPTGITVDIARELGARLEVPVELLTFDAARKSFEAMREGRADVRFLAVDPAREGTVAFTAPYAVIEGVFGVPADSPLTSADEVDRPGVRVGVKKGSAYDLFLTRELAEAEVVRGAESVEAFLDGALEAVAGIRLPIEGFAAERGDVRVLEPHFMEIRQAMGTSRDRAEETVAYLRAFIEDLKASGFVADSLHRAGRRDAKVAPAG